MASQSLAVTTANVDPDTATAWFKIEMPIECQAFDVSFSGNGNSGTATIEAKLRKNDGTSIKTSRGTATVGVSRTGADGASGEYHAPVVFGDSGNQWVDATGHIPGQQTWWVGVVAFGTITGGTLTVAIATEV